VKFNKVFIFLLITGFSLMWLPKTAISEKSEIKWYSYKDGMEKIKKENKKGFLHFYTNWCTFCKLMNSNTFSDPKVISYLNDNFVPIRINAEQEQDVAKSYNVNRFPTTFFIAEDISSIGNRPGYIPAGDLLDMLIYIHSNSYKTMTFSAYMEQKKANTDARPSEPNM
jgi:thioredoxin-related protein